ncbi:unnamed protein product [Trifolium pratense]|uniref:Uncharacterized protein n=1 Tax=Trifolium pratense TaxID=57577 RepID=A0ACB0ILH6_TRIPR|nr:unnamed protein product [Trifolium pratense]
MKRKKKYEAETKVSEERLKQALDAESKIIQLKTDMQRLEEKFTDVEFANQLLQKQSLLNTCENNSGAPLFPCMEVSGIIKNIGFNHGKPVAAFTIYKCLLHWKSFEAEKSSVFEDQDDNDLMAYWLSNTSTLLFLLEQSLKSGSSTNATSVGKPPNPTSLFGRMTMGFRSSPSSANLAAPSSVVVRKAIHHKYRISYDEIVNDLCPILCVQQLCKICTLYWNDNYNTQRVSPHVLASMKMDLDSNNSPNDSFLLDDSSSIPFSVDDLSASLQEKDFSVMKAADELLENPAFQFLIE